MSSPKIDKKAERDAMRERIYRLQGGERLKAWMDFTLLECADEDHHVSQQDDASLTPKSATSIQYMCS